MNWVLVGVIIIIGFNAFLGYKKGFVKIILSLVAMIATVFITMMITPIASNYIKSNTNWYNNLKKTTYESMQRNHTVDNAFDELGKTQDLGVITNVNQTNSSLEAVTGQVVDKLTIPSNLKNEIKANVNVEKYVSSGITSVKDMITDALAEKIASIIFNLIIFLVVFIIIYIIMQFIIQIIDIVSLLPVLKQINKSAGFFLGLAKGLIVVWVFFMVMTIFCDTEFAHTIFANINENSFLAFLYNNNLILNLIFAIF